METIKVKEGDIKIAANPKERFLIELRDKLKENIMKTEISLDLDKDMLHVVHKKLEKFK